MRTGEPKIIAFGLLFIFGLLLATQHEVWAWLHELGHYIVIHDIEGQPWVEIEQYRVIHPYPASLFGRLAGGGLVLLTLFLATGVCALGGRVHWAGLPWGMAHYIVGIAYGSSDLDMAGATEWWTAFSLVILALGWWAVATELR